ncbi:hypothetical protein D3C72_2024990 [compost metagenome]
MQEAHHRGVFDFGDGLLVGIARGVGRDVVELELGADDAVDRFRSTGCGGFDHARELVVLRNDPVHAHLRRELDFLRGLLVRRVGRCDDQAVVALAENDDAVRMAELRIEQVLGQALVIDGVEVEQRGAEGA